MSFSVLYIVSYSALPYSRNLLQEVIFVNLVVLLSEIIFANFDYRIHNRRYMEDIWIQKCVSALIFGNAFEITKFTKKLKKSNKFLLHGTYWSCSVLLHPVQSSALTWTYTLEVLI